jgi:prophage regulatory protein
MKYLPESGFLRIWQVIGDARRGIPPLIPVCRSLWWKGVKEGRFPQPVRMGRTTMWRVGDIKNLIDVMGGK